LTLPEYPLILHFHGAGHLKKRTLREQVLYLMNGACPFVEMMQRKADPEFCRHELKNPMAATGVVFKKNLKLEKS